MSGWRDWGLPPWVAGAFSAVTGAAGGDEVAHGVGSSFGAGGEVVGFVGGGAAPVAGVLVAG